MSPSSLITREFEVRNFLEDQTNLDVMTYLAEGFSFRQIADKIRKKHSYVQSKSDFLKKHAIMVFNRWNIDIQALGMVKTAEFYEYREEIKNEILGNEYKNFYLSYLVQVIMGEMKYFAMYTFPEEIRNRIGFEITNWYYTFPHFTLPFFKNGQFEKEFDKIFEEENNENTLPPRGQKIKNPDLIDIYTCRYVQLELGDINLRRYTSRMRDEIGDLVDVRYSTVLARFEKLKEKNIIYPVNPLNFKELPYVNLFFITEYDQIFRFMKTLSRLNIVVAISFTKTGKNILHLQCPYEKGSSIANALSRLDKKSQMFSITNLYVNRGLPYEYYLEKYEK